MTIEEIKSELISFFAVAVVFLIVIAIVFKIFCRKFSFKDKNVEFYGLLLNLNTQSLISMATLTINYLFLVWCTISFNGLNIIYIALMFILILINEAVLDNFDDLPISIGLLAINCGAIQIIYLIYQHLTEVEFSYLLLLVLFLVILFVFLYYTYNLLRGINNVVVKHKYLKNKKYTV